MKKHFNKEFVMTKEDNEDFENSTKCWIFDNDYIDGDVKVRDHWKYRGPEHGDCNINVKLNHKISFIFLNLKLWFTSYYARTRQIQSQIKCHTK